jgi:hypothetical protein
MARPLRLAGALVAFFSLWAPWYVVHIPEELRRAAGIQAGQLPPGYAELARGLLAILPSSLRVDGWQAFAGADVAVALLAAAIAISVFVAIDERAVLAATAALAGVVLYHVVREPGSASFVTVQVGPWIALAGAAAAGLSAWPRPTPPVAAEPWPAPLPVASVAPPPAAAPHGKT